MGHLNFLQLLSCLLFPELNVFPFLSFPVLFSSCLRALQLHTSPERPVPQRATGTAAGNTRKTQGRQDGHPHKAHAPHTASEPAPPDGTAPAPPGSVRGQQVTPPSSPHHAHTRAPSPAPAAQRTQAQNIRPAAPPSPPPPVGKARGGSVPQAPQHGVTAPPHTRPVSPSHSQAQPQPPKKRIPREVAALLSPGVLAAAAPRAAAAAAAAAAAEAARLTRRSSSSTAGVPPSTTTRTGAGAGSGGMGGAASVGLRGPAAGELTGTTHGSPSRQSAARHAAGSHQVEHAEPGAGPRVTGAEDGGSMDPPAGKDAPRAAPAAATARQAPPPGSGSGSGSRKVASVHAAATSGAAAVAAHAQAGRPSPGSPRAADAAAAAALKHSAGAELGSSTGAAGSQGAHAGKDKRADDRHMDGREAAAAAPQPSVPQAARPTAVPAQPAAAATAASSGGGASPAPPMAGSVAVAAPTPAAARPAKSSGGGRSAPRGPAGLSSTSASMSLSQGSLASRGSCLLGSGGGGSGGGSEEPLITASMQVGRMWRIGLDTSQHMRGPCARRPEHVAACPLQHTARVHVMFALSRRCRGKTAVGASFICPLHACLLACAVCLPTVRTCGPACIWLYGCMHGCRIWWLTRRACTSSCAPCAPSSGGSTRCALALPCGLWHDTMMMASAAVIWLLEVPLTYMCAGEGLKREGMQQIMHASSVPI